MTSSTVELDARTALEALEVAVDGLLAAGLGTVEDDSLLQMLREFEVQRRRLTAVDARVVGEVHARRLGPERGARDTTALLAPMLRIDGHEARARVRAAENFASRSTLTGEVLEPAYPQLAHALSGGVIHPSQAARIARTIDRLPVDVQAAMDRQIEGELLAEARRFAPHQLARLCQRLTYLYDQDGTLSDESDRSRRRSLDYRRHPDGSLTGSFHLDPTTAEAFETVLDSHLANLSAEQRGNRTPAQQRHDAFRDLLFLLLRSEQLPKTAGVTTTIVITLTWQQWLTLLTLTGITTTDTTTETAADAAEPDRETDTGPPGRGELARRRRPPGEWLAETNHGAFLTLGEIAPLLGEAQTLPVVLANSGSVREVAAYGDKHRLFSENQRLAMVARDRGCTFPGCTSTPAYCEAHHITDHTDGGPTTVANGALVCGYHHRTFTRSGWQCVMHEGAPAWIPPTWIDPTRTPQRNTTHDTGMTRK